MRVTCAVREYVRKAIFEKVKSRYEAAKKAKDAAVAARDERIRKAKEIADRLVEEAQRKFAAECKKKLGLSWIPDTYDWNGKVSEKGGNYAFRSNADEDDFFETVSEGSHAAKHHGKCAERASFAKTCKEPERIKEAAEHAADKLLFELELGKVAKKELDEALKDLEVKL